ncbi:hypothetical protein BD311DRAFT_779188 [Dichomitus squalens]|uniref:GST N-terminal domain-containing protein n=1 Tax=Dichomitus squalens TaxID=114155 RepID=A0A4Q9MI92_9APHY|nr:hypothetical protein BD311DRAFT_779188 [Dichomitus squalens]
MSDPIVLYDIPLNANGTAWSPHTWRTRYTLNYKNLAYRTVWVPYTSIEPTSKRLAARPTSLWPDDAPRYTLPAIFDPSTNTPIADSIAIARYLDAQYPHTPRVIPEGTEGFHEAFLVALDAVTSPALRNLAMPASLVRIDDEAAKAKYKRDREWQVGGAMEEWAPEGSEKRVGLWRELEAGLAKVAKWYEAGEDKDRKFLMGDDPVMADFVVAGRLMWLKVVLGEEHEEWKAVETWHEGRWAKLLKDLELYAEVKV